MPRKFIVTAGSAMALSIGLGSPAQAQEATIDWDEWGVPHIDAPAETDAAYAMGWAQARGRADELVELLVRGRGRAAQHWGEEYLESDVEMWTAGIPQATGALLAAQSPEAKAIIAAYVDGINGYLAAHPSALSDERKRALPITSEDVIGHSQRVVSLTFMAGRELGRVQAELAQRAQRDASAGRPDGEPVEEDERGSNGWAIAPSRSASGNAMLLQNPHLPWDGVFRWFESHVDTPDRDSYGVTLLGQPIQTILFNEHLGWTHTVNRLDAADTYELELVEGGYRHGERVLPFTTETVTLAVRQSDGSTIRQTVPVMRSVHGPVVARADGKAYSMRVAGLADPQRAGLIDQYMAMARASSREHFEEAMARLQMPMFNAIYADRAGEILYLSNGLHPVRATGDADYWSGIVDGGDPALVWSEYHPYEQLLRVANPPSGFVQNANETGYTATLPTVLDPADFPADYIAPDLYPRPMHSLSLLLDDQSITFEELVDYAHSTRLVLAELVGDDLIAALRRNGSSQATRAADVLEAWDRRTDAESRGAALFSMWAFAAMRDGTIAYEEDWSYDDPDMWPKGIADEKEAQAVAGMIALVDRADAAGVPLDLPWGALARVPDGSGGTLPSDLAPGELGAFRVAYLRPRQDTLGLEFLGGTGWLAAIEFSDTIRARALLPYGNFAQLPASMKEQYSLYARGELRSVNYTDTAIEEATVMREELDTGAR